MTQPSEARTAGSYGFTCGWCDANLSTPFDDHYNAEKFAHDAGWRMTLGDSARWGFGAHNTCPWCIPIGFLPKPLYVESPAALAKTGGEQP